ncbi:hypothetical protein [Actinocatenispora thailandica]|uniref:hypothetical protein n=1 Tax=Actinocatenispora thailandica TaxID=227318 RepID=UPI0019527578|nr:hypothetical protein [Actinocatenispora thailandica]
MSRATSGQPVGYSSNPPPAALVVRDAAATTAHTLLGATKITRWPPDGGVATRRQAA